MKKGRGVAREFTATYRTARTYIMYLMLRLGMSRAVTLFTTTFLHGVCRGQIHISLSFAKERFRIFNFCKFNKRFYV